MVIVDEAERIAELEMLISHKPVVRIAVVE